MSTQFNDSLSETVRNSFCTILGTINNFNDYFSRLPFGATNLSYGIAQYAYRNICDREPPPIPPPPFSGGQCLNVQYDVSWSVTYQYFWKGSDISTTGPSTITCTGRFYGTISSFNYVLNNEGYAQIQIYCNHRDGRSQIGSSSAGNNVWECKVISQGTPIVTRVDGQADSCGDPPPIYQPPGDSYNTQNINISYTDNSNNQVDIDATLTIGSPQLTLNGDINIPIRILSPDITIPISGKFSVNNPSVTFDFSDSNFNTTNNTYNGSDYDTPEPPPDVPPDVPCPVQPTNPSEPDVETVRTIRGVLVTVTELSDNETVIYQDGNPDIYVPNFGYVSFLCQVGQQLGWTVDIAVKNRRNLIMCPWEGGAIRVEGTPRNGVEWTLSEVYAKEEQTVTFEV